MRARAAGSAGRSGGSGKRSSKYSAIAVDSGRTLPSSSTSAGTRPVGLMRLYASLPRPPGGATHSMSSPLA